MNCIYHDFIQPHRMLLCSVTLSINANNAKRGLLLMTNPNLLPTGLSYISDGDILLSC